MSMEELFGSDLESEEEDGNEQHSVKDDAEELPSTQAHMEELFGDSPEDAGDGEVEPKSDVEGDEDYEGNDVDQEDIDDRLEPMKADDDNNEDLEDENPVKEDSEEEEEEEDDLGPKPTQEDIFGEELDVSSDEGGQEEQSPVAPVPEELDDLDMLEDSEMKRVESEGQAEIEAEGEGEGEGPEEEHGEEEGHVINIELPRLDATLGKDIFFVKLPNFLSIETKPFDPNFYEDEIDDDEVLDEEGRSRLKLKVENTIRWRHGEDKDGNTFRESNARVVKWSDGSLSLHLGNEIFDIFRMKIQGEQNHLFVQQGTGLQSRAVFKEKFSFRPHSTLSQTHRKMTMSIADRMSKTQKIRVLPALEKDPESQRQEMLKKEEERVRAQTRRESQQRRIRERSHTKGLTSAYLEGEFEDGDEQELEESLAAIKNRYKKELTGSKGDSNDVQDVYSDDESDGDEKLMNAKVDISSDDDDGPRGAKRKAEDDVTRKKKASRKIIEESDEEDD